MNNDLKFTTGDATWTRLRTRALSDLFWFNSVVLGYANLFPLEVSTHLLVHRFIERRTGIPDIDLAPMQLLLMPRETGKSSTATIGHAIQMACANPEIAILIANEKQLLAQDFIKSIKNHFETNDLLRSLFPEVIPDDLNHTEWSQTRATLKRKAGRPEPTFDCIGVGGAVTGRHFDVILCDDLISKDAVDNARTGSWSVMESVNFWISTLRPLLSIGAKPFPWIRLVGTRWYPRDAYEFAEQTFSHGEEARRYLIKAQIPGGSVAVREVTRAGDLATMTIAGIEQGQAVFPKIWSLDRCEKMRDENAELFAAFVMNDPSNQAVRTFQDDWIKDRKWQHLDKTNVCYRKDDGAMRFILTADLRKVLVCDPAFTAGPQSDRSAIVVLGVDMEMGKYLVLEALAQKIESRDLVVDIIETAKRWRVSNVYIESVAQQAGFIQFVQSEARNRNAGLNIETVRPGSRNKDLRIESLSSYFKDGRIYWHGSQHDLWEEYRKFRPGTRYYRDLLDALAYAVEKAPLTSGGVTGNAAQRSRYQLSDYYKRRGLQPD